MRFQGYNNLQVSLHLVILLSVYECLSELLMLLLSRSPCGPPHCYHSERNCSPCIIKQFELTWLEFNYVTHEALLLEAFKSNILAICLEVQLLDTLFKAASYICMQLDS